MFERRHSRRRWNLARGRGLVATVRGPGVLAPLALAITGRRGPVRRKIAAVAAVAVGLGVVATKPASAWGYGYDPNYGYGYGAFGPYAYDFSYPYYRLLWLPALP